MKINSELLEELKNLIDDELEKEILSPSKLIEELRLSFVRLRKNLDAWIEKFLDKLDEDKIAKLKEANYIYEDKNKNKTLHQLRDFVNNRIIELENKLKINP